MTSSELKELRMSRALKQGEFARKLEVSESLIRACESGRMPISVKFRRKIALFLRDEKAQEKRGGMRPQANAAFEQEWAELAAEYIFLMSPEARARPLLDQLTDSRALLTKVMGWTWQRRRQL